MRKRIWELDALRGLLLLAITVFHLAYDLIFLYALVPLKHPAVYQFFNDWLGVPFVVLSGLCVTLGKNPVRRGITVLLGGMAVTVATGALYFAGAADVGILIYFGVLHCLGVCMLLWPLLGKLPSWALAALGGVIIALGLGWIDQARVDFPWLIPLGIRYWGFSSSDYYPLLPNLGYFCLGAVLGRLLYAKKQSLLPRINDRSILIRPLCFLGRHSLLFYLLHQPVLAGAVGLYTLLF